MIFICTSQPYWLSTSCCSLYAQKKWCVVGVFLTLIWFSCSAAMGNFIFITHFKSSLSQSIVCFLKVYLFQQQNHDSLSQCVENFFFKNAKLFNETYTRLECMPQRCRKSKTKEHRIRLAAKACFLDPNLVFLFAVIGNFRFIMHFRSLLSQTKVCHCFTE